MDIERKLDQRPWIEGQWAQSKQTLDTISEAETMVVGDCLSWYGSLWACDGMKMQIVSRSCIPTLN